MGKELLESNFHLKFAKKKQSVSFDFQFPCGFQSIIVVNCYSGDLFPVYFVFSLLSSCVDLACLLQIIPSSNLVIMLRLWGLYMLT